MSKVDNYNCSLPEERTEPCGFIVFLFLMQGTMGNDRAMAITKTSNVYIFQLIISKNDLDFCS